MFSLQYDKKETLRDLVMSLILYSVRLLIHYSQKYNDREMETQHLERSFILKVSELHTPVTS